MVFTAGEVNQTHDFSNAPCFHFRMELEYESSSPKALLRISPVEIEDEADYKCEITYWEVREDCETVHIIKLKTLGE